LITTRYIQSDFNLKLSKRRIKSQGYFKLNNIWAKFKSSPLKIADLNSDILFNDNEVEIANTNILINDTKFNLKGLIDSKTNTDLVFELENLPLSI
jgi:autotransporter translocation and assembly factor TamB